MNRPVLKAKRTFGSHQNYPHKTNSNHPNTEKQAQGQKRTYTNNNFEEPQNNNKSMKINETPECYSRYVPQSKKSMANDRLKKLRENLNTPDVNSNSPHVGPPSKLQTFTTTPTSIRVTKNFTNDTKIVQCNTYNSQNDKKRQENGAYAKYPTSRPSISPKDVLPSPKYTENKPGANNRLQNLRRSLENEKSPKERVPNCTSVSDRSPLVSSSDTTNDSFKTAKTNGFTYSPASTYDFSSGSDNLKNIFQTVQNTKLNCASTSTPTHGGTKGAAQEFSFLAKPSETTNYQSKVNRNLFKRKSPKYKPYKLKNGAPSDTSMTSGDNYENRSSSDTATPQKVQETTLKIAECSKNVKVLEQFIFSQNETPKRVVLKLPPQKMGNDVNRGLNLTENGVQSQASPFLDNNSSFTQNNISCDNLKCFENLDASLPQNGGLDSNDVIGDVEQMEWTEIDEVLKNLDNKNCSCQKNETCEERVNLQYNQKTEHDQEKKASNKNEKQKVICIVVDTNIFISNLPILREIASSSADTIMPPIIYIPWMVINELDYMKDDKKSANGLKSKAQNAIKFMNNMLINEPDKVIGQNVFDMDTQKHISKSPDDKILSTCIQALNKYESVILLSNDMNLKNKALINKIGIASPNDIMRKITAKDKKIKKILNTMSLCCSFIICECSKEAYGNVWSKMDLLQSPPWSLEGCITRFKKYWTAVFSEKLLKQFLKNLDDLTLILNKMGFRDGSSDFEKFVNQCMSVCVFLKDIDQYKATVERTIRDIMEIKSS